PNIEIIAPARVINLETQAGCRVVTFERNGQTESIAAQLVVAADGARSVARDAVGIGATTWDYDQVAIVTNVLSQRFHDYVAYERFTPSGPIALRPVSDGRCGVVWTLAPAIAKEVMELSDDDFVARLPTDFGFRLGRFTRVGQRHAYPL